jgi:rod shape determining protein RodA
MQRVLRLTHLDYRLLFAVGFLMLLGTVVLRSIASFIFPQYFFYVVLAILAFFLFVQLDFEVVSLFSKHLYVGSVIFLTLPLIIGQVTRGAIRWLPLGPLTVQPSEIARPFLLIFFANYLTQKPVDSKRLLKVLLLLALPIFLILIQPSLGVAILTLVGFLGVLLAADFKKKYLLFGLGAILVLIPLLWEFLAPYQRQRIISFINPSGDPYGAGYNSIQSMISVGSGKLFGRGLGKGVQTQLAFLPERHTDFIFAATAEELGFVGVVFLLLGQFIILWLLIRIMEGTKTIAGRAFVSGLFLSFFAQVVIHVGMNLGILPITGVPLPLVSAGGSSLLATMSGLGLASGVKQAVVA